MGTDAPIDVGCYDIRGRDLQTYFGQFTRRRLPEEALIALSVADSVFPEMHPGYMGWLTVITHTDLFAKHLADWAVALGRQVAKARTKRGRRYCEAWRPGWGRQAALDGLVIGVFGPLKGDVRRHVPGLHERADEFGVAAETYGKIRGFVAGSFDLAVNQYESSLQWVMRYKLYKRGWSGMDPV